MQMRALGCARRRQAFLSHFLSLHSLPPSLPACLPEASNLRRGKCVVKIVFTFNSWE